MDCDLFLKKYRTTRNLTQKELAHRLDIGREHYARLECGGRKPSVNMLEKISSKLGTNVTDIIKHANGDSLDNTVLEIIEHVLMMDEQQRKKILLTAREIVGGGVEIF